LAKRLQAGVRFACFGRQKLTENRLPRVAFYLGSGLIGIQSSGRSETSAVGEKGRRRLCVGGGCGHAGGTQSIAQRVRSQGKERKEKEKDAKQKRLGEVARADPSRQAKRWRSQGGAREVLRWW
jgi:hypothetical protein